MDKLKMAKEFFPGAAAAAGGLVILMYNDPVQAFGTVMFFGGVIWIGYSILVDVLDRLGMSISDFYF